MKPLTARNGRFGSKRDVNKIRKKFWESGTVCRFWFLDGNEPSKTGSVAELNRADCANRKITGNSVKPNWSWSELNWSRLTKPLPSLGHSMDGSERGDWAYRTYGTCGPLLSGAVKLFEPTEYLRLKQLSSLYRMQKAYLKQTNCFRDGSTLDILILYQFTDLYSLPIMRQIDMLTVV